MMFNEFSKNMADYKEKYTLDDQNFTKIKAKSNDIYSSNSKKIIYFYIVNSRIKIEININLNL